MNKDNSVHLQNFPDLSLFDSEEVLIRDMDMVRDICATALFIRDQKNLRVRLPLNELVVIGYQANKMADYKDIIADEVNVKKVEIINQIDDLAELKLQINFKKIGSKFGHKIKEISFAAKDGNWQKNSENQVLIAGLILEKDEFEIKLTAKNHAENPNRISAALNSNDCLIELDTEVTKQLEEEGLARDIVRIIQQNRKDANLNISDKIKIKIYNSNKDLLDVVASHSSYIAEQVMAKEIKACLLISEVKNCRYSFENQLDSDIWLTGIDL